MTQREKQSSFQAPVVGIGENPYLERVMRLIGVSISIAVTIFAFVGIFGVIAGGQEDLIVEHTGGLNRIDTAIQARLDRYTTDLTDLRNDRALWNHLTGTPDIEAASSRAGEVIFANLNEYQRIDYIAIDNGVPSLAFSRINNNNSVTDVIVHPANTTYHLAPQSRAAFESVLDGTTSSIVMGDFYVRTDDQGRIEENPVMLLDAFVPIDTGTGVVMLIALKIDTGQLRSIVNLAPGELVNNEDGGVSRRVTWLEINTGDINNVVADSGAIGIAYIENTTATFGNVDGNDYYERFFTVNGLLTGTDEPIQSFGNNIIYSAKIVAYPGLNNLSWRIIITDNAFTLYSPTITAILGIALLATILSMAVVFITKRMLRPMFEPIYEADTLVQTSAHDGAITVRSRGDQAEFISAARRISTRLNRLSDEVQKQTARRNRDMQVAGRIGRETATLTDLDTLANRSINLICNELGFYHAQIFMLDRSKTYAILRYSRGEAGQRLINFGHRLAIGSDTVIGTVSAEKRPVIVNDTVKDSADPHSVNPLLGETRAEMGLPLQIGDDILGVLDIQSRSPNVFLTEDIPTYQLVADQLAVAIYNAQLREQSDRRIEQIDTLNRQLTREAWIELENKLDLEGEYGSSVENARLSADISVRGEVLGSLEADLPEGQQFSEGDRQILNSVAERVSLAIENARLFQETQSSLSETSTLYQLSRQLNEANDLEDVLEAIIVSVAGHASGGQVWLFDDILPGESPDWARITVDLPIMPRVNNITLSGKRLQLSQYPFMEQLSGTDIASVDDITALNNIRDDLRSMFMAVNAVAIIFIPLNMRGSWKGFMSISFDRARNFSDREHRIYTALIAQAGVAIDNRLLLQQTEDALARQEKLYAASRIINTSQGLSDLVFAAVATSSEPQLDFWLALLEGEKDSTGWTEISRIVARSQSGNVQEAHEKHDLFVPEHSPMRRREPEILVDPGEDIEDVPAPVKWMRDLQYKFIAIFPLFSDNEPIALFYIVNREAYDLSQDDYEVYRALTGQMSTQIQNRSLLSQTEETLGEIRRLYVATRAISGAQDTSAIYDAVAGHLSMPFIQQSTRMDEELNISITVLLAYPEPDIEAPQLRYEYHWSNDPSRPVSMQVGHILSQEDLPFGSLIAANDDSILVYKSIDEMPDDFPMLREVLSENGATAAAVAPLWSRMLWFGVMIFSTDKPDLLDVGYTRFMQSIADQVAIAVENQKLLQETQYERQRLDEILETLPVGVLVLDPETLEPVSTNARVSQLLGQTVRFNEPFNSSTYNMYRTGTNLFYPNDELPMYLVRETGEQVEPADDVAIIGDITRTDLLISAAPIFDANGNQRAIVAAFQDISNLRSMENTMQENLRETVLLYETQRALNEAEDLDSLLDALIMQLAMQQPADAYLLLSHEDNEIELVRSILQPVEEIEALHPILQNQVVNVDDVARYTGLDDDTRRVLSAVDARSVLVLPLIVRARPRPLGWMMLIDDAPEAFTFDQERTLGSVADMASQAIDNNYLVESTRVALAETEALYNANTALSRTRDRFDLFETIDNLLENLQPDMRAGYIIVDGELEEMFKEGFDESEANGLDIAGFLQLPLLRDEGLFVEDISRNTMSRLELEVAKSGNIMAFAAINLRVKDMPGGRLLLGWKNPRRFGKGDERYLNTIADSASVVIDNQMLLGQVQSTLQETSVLYQASKALVETDDPQEIINVIVTYLIEPHINQVFIALLDTPDWDNSSASVEVVASWQANSDVDLRGVSLNPEQFPAWSQLATDSVLTINDIYDEQYGLDIMEQNSIESLDIRSMVILPLRVPGRAIGAIWLGSDQAYTYTDRDLRVFQSFAEQTSLSLEAKRLLEQTEQRATQLQTSAVISQSVGQILDLDILLPQVVDLIKQQFNYDHVQVFLMDEESDWALLRASTGEAGQTLLDIGHKLQRGSASVIGRVTELGEPTIALDTADATVVHKPNPYLPMTRSEMALPMVIKGEIVGALDVQSNSPNAFTDEDVQVLTTLASQIAVAIDNARLYDESQQSAEDMSFLFEITSQAASAETLDEALQYIAGEVRKNLRADLVAIYLPQDYEDYYGNRKRMIEVAVIDSEEGIVVDSTTSVEVGDADSIIGMVSDTTRLQIIPNIEREIRYRPVSTDSKSAVVIPITSGTTVVGIITLESRRVNAYAHENLTVLQPLSGSVGAVIQNTLLVEQLQESVEQLREVDRLKSQFLASMSHELRTPLNSIIGFSRVMLKGIDGPLSEMQEQDLTTIYNSGNHLLRLINDILDQAKIEANELNLRFSFFDIKPLVESVKSIAIGLLKEKPELQLHVEIADGLPKAYGDEIRSRQILLNLVTNAIKFTEDGSVTIDVYAIEGDPAPMLKVDVIDTGLGIAEQDLPTVFEQFRQVDNSLTRTVGGTGLGLPISKSFTEMQGGKLTVASEVNVGSTFSVTIPTYEGAEEELERKREAKRSAPKAVASSKTNTSTSSGLISKEDVERAKALGSKSNGSKDSDDEPQKKTVDTQEFQKQKGQNRRIDTNVTRSIPMVTQKRHVILVEDDKTMVDQFRRILQREGFEVTTADFAAFAEAMIGQIRPGVVILDVNFAEGKGWELLQNLKERDDTFDIPVVVTTLDEDSERAYRLGAHTFLQRPFLPDEVLKAVLAAEKESQRERIVIIDDQPDAIRLLTHLLEKHSDFKVYSAQSGDEGISLVARRRPDLIILDLRMPGKDGFAVLDELRGNPETAKIPVLVVTGEMDLDRDEEEQLVDIHILRKTDISQEEYDLFIDNVRSYLDASNKK